MGKFRDLFPSGLPRAYLRRTSNVDLGYGNLVRKKYHLLSQHDDSSVVRHSEPQRIRMTNCSLGLQSLAFGTRVANVCGPKGNR
jgi:hypothetical protein